MPAARTARRTGLAAGGPATLTTSPLASKRVPGSAPRNDDGAAPEAPNSTIIERRTIDQNCEQVAFTRSIVALRLAFICAFSCGERSEMLLSLKNLNTLASAG